MHVSLKHYLVDTEFPDVSGAEQVEMFQIRDQLATLAPSLSPDEQALLLMVDRRLIQQAAQFHAELCRFIDLAQHRQAHTISVDRWWWYLDVLAQLPSLPVLNTPTQISKAS